MTIEELRAAALAAAMDENNTIGWYLRWDAYLCAFRWEVAFTAVEEQPDWADGSWPTVGEAVKAAELACSWVAPSFVQTKQRFYWVDDWDGLSNTVTASRYRRPSVVMPIGEIQAITKEDLSQYFEVAEGEE